MSATNFNTRNDTFRKLMGNGLTYHIPHFQRDYSWTEEEWEDLWLDIQETIKPGGETAHYMGYLVLQTEDDKIFEVIDGQQRLTTISLIVLAILKELNRLIEAGKDPDHNKLRMDQIRQTYIGYLDPVTLILRSKLALNRNKDRYFQTYLVPLAQLPVRGFRASEHLLRKAFEWFDRNVREYIRRAEGDQGVALATLVETMSDRLFFTVITVTDELNAYKVFETLNARSVRLSSTDLLKNYLFSELHKSGASEHEVQALEDRWEAMVGRVGSESFPDFLRVHWNSRKSFVRQSELFKTIRAVITNREKVFALLRDMEEDIDTYMNLLSPESSHWPASHKEHARLLRLFSVRQPFPLILASYRRWQQQDIETLLQACVVISFRYNVIGGKSAGEQERVYTQLAVNVATGAAGTLREVLTALISIYPNDELFRTTFTQKQLRTSQSRNYKVVRYILGEIERKETGAVYDFESESFTIEHILPQNPEEGWDAFTDQEVETSRYRIGNMTLLETSWNKEIGNGDFASKKPIYSQSKFAITKRIASENAEWTPARIEEHQKWMAKQATSIWRIAQLH